MCIVYTYNLINICIICIGTTTISKYFPQIEENHTEKISINREDIGVDINNLVKGLCPGIQMDVYHIGFPSLHLIPITVSKMNILIELYFNQYIFIIIQAKLQRRNVKVFQSPSMGENMIIQIINKNENDDNSLQHIAKELLGNTLYVNWPHLEEMKQV